MSYLRVESLKKSFMKGGFEISVLKAVDLSYEKGKFLSIVGASGAGKSTFLHILGGLDHPTGGEVYLEDQPIYKKSEEELAFYRNKTVGFVFQFHHLLPEFTAIENVALPMMIGGASKDESMLKAEAMLVEVGLKERGSHKPGELSGGEQQRVAIARALINDPSILLADEPTGNLDSKTGQDIYDLLENEKEKRGMSLIVVTHNEELAKKADLRIRLRDGLTYYE